MPADAGLDDDEIVIEPAAHRAVLRRGRPRHRAPRGCRGVGEPQQRAAHESISPEPDPAEPDPAGSDLVIAEAERETKCITIGEARGAGLEAPVRDAFVMWKRK